MRFSLNGTVYQNNSRVVLGHICGGVNTLFCTTNLASCCTSNFTESDLGPWIFPNGTTIPHADNGGDFYQSRGWMRVGLNIRRSGVEGIYRCEIPDSMNVTQTIYIGVYRASTSTGE